MILLRFGCSLRIASSSSAETAGRIYALAGPDGQSDKGGNETTLGDGRGGGGEG
ncbi:hypothetical protein ACIBF1_18360 [Spirillospora sp. NPDC050679]